MHKAGAGNEEQGELRPGANPVSDERVKVGARRNDDSPSRTVEIEDGLREIFDRPSRRFTRPAINGEIDDGGEDARNAPSSEPTRPELPDMPTPVAASAAGLVLEPPRLVDCGELARGGMGTIRKVYDRHIRRHEAMKLISSELMRDSAAAARFLDEAQITGQLEHPNILPVYELALDDTGAPSYFTMKLAHGKTLSKVLTEMPLKERFGRPVERLLRVLVKVCEAVAYAHSRGVVHRDLKPDNVIIGSLEQVYVLDWGCAKLLGRDDADESAETEEARALDVSGRVREQHGSVVGTYSYMPPEQARGEVHKIDARTDVHALGGILYKILTDVAPHRAEDPRDSLLRAQNGDVLPPEVAVPYVRLPPELCRIAMKALADDPAERYQTVLDYKEDIERFLRAGMWFASRVFPAGSVIVREGDVPHAAFIIESGECDVFKTEEGRQERLRRMGPGDVFGEAAILSDSMRTATVVARDELHVIELTRESLEQELSRDSWTGALVHALASRFRDLDTRLSELRKAQALVRAKTWIDAHLAYRGKVGVDGSAVAPYAELAARLLVDGDVTEEELREAVKRAGDLEIDDERDVLVRVAAT